MNISEYRRIVKFVVNFWVLLMIIIFSVIAKANNDEALSAKYK